METAQSLGIHGAIEYHLEVLVSCTGVADFPRQAEFHPLKFIDILARQYDKYILLGGRAHRIGENQVGGQYNALKESAKTMFPKNTVSACWSNQDCITTDNIPFIGQYASEHPNWFVATRFQKWGMDYKETE